MIRGILANNVIALRDQRYGHLGSETARNKQLAEDIGSQLSQIQRLCAGEIGTSIDTIEWLAEALQVRPQDLLTPYFANAKGAPLSEPLSAAGGAPLQQRQR